MLFPAYAGVIPTVGGKEMSMEAFPRLRGGDPPCTPWRGYMRIFSPPMRG